MPCPGHWPSHFGPRWLSRSKVNHSVVGQKQGGAEVKAVLVYKWAKVASMYWLPDCLRLHRRLRFISSKAHRYKTQNFIHPIILKNPKKQIFSYLGPTCFAYLVELYQCLWPLIQQSLEGYKTPSYSGLLELSNPDTPCRAAKQPHIGSEPVLQSPSPWRVPLPPSPSGWWSQCHKPPDSLMLWGTYTLMQLYPNVVQ